jgi:hypothetical protein
MGSAHPLNFKVSFKETWTCQKIIFRIYILFSILDCWLLIYVSRMLSKNVRQDTTKLDLKNVKFYNQAETR